MNRKRQQPTYHNCPECGKKGAYIVRHERYGGFVSVHCRYCGMYADLELANGRRRWAKVEGRP